MGDTGRGWKKIVAATDLEDTGDHALREAMRIARKLGGSELHLVTVVKVAPEMHDAKEVERLDTDIEQAMTALRERVQDVCAPISEDLAFSHESHLHVRLGQPAEAIHQLAIDIDADVIVVGTHQRTGLRKLVLGSVAEKLVELAHVPVLVAQPKSLEGLPKSGRADAPRPGGDGGHSSRETLHFRPRTSHIAGLV